MGGIGLLHGVVGNLLRNLNSSAMKEYCDKHGYQSEYELLYKSTNDIEARLVEFEGYIYLPRYLVSALRDSIYYVDDLIDELLTREHLKWNKTGLLNKKVRRFLFSFGFSYKLSREIQLICKKLDSIVEYRVNYGHSADFNPVRNRGTSSFVYEEDIIGRNEELVLIVDMLLGPDVHEDVGFVSIVGIGGLGKTTLAQLVYNDHRVIESFCLRIWVCVSDNHGSQSFLKTILGQIADAATHVGFDEWSMEDFQHQLRKTLEGKKYLLVLDDIWCEKQELFDELKSFLSFGRRGSRILVTTRSHEVARIAGGSIFELQGLSEEDTWRLFERSAFSSSLEGTPELVDIGRKIAKLCAHVPLAIRVVGSLLYGQSVQKWNFFLENISDAIFAGDNGILHILKLSYNNLKSPLKSCFGYCALFPRDLKIKREMLIRLWIAQGFIVPSPDIQSIEDVAETYFRTLLRRCFFQDVERNRFGEVIACKIHDLMHDLAQHVTGEDISVVNSLKNNLGVNFYHMFHAVEDFEDWTSIEIKLRSYLQDGLTKHFPVTMFKKLSHLRVLDLHKLDIKTLPNSIGNLLHLRYLDLSCNNALTTFPSSLTKLHNLQTLNLSYCELLEELPKHMSNLVCLRYLDIHGSKLKHMPSGLDKLTCLRVLTNFFVAEDNLLRKQSVGQLQDLKSLLNLKGDICITIPENTDTTGNNRKGGYLMNLKYLKTVAIVFRGSDSVPEAMHKTWLEMLQPHPDLKVLELRRYQSVTIPRWGTEDNWVTILPNLVDISLISCKWLRELPSLSQLRHLKSLVIHDLRELEYMENSTGCSTVASASGSVVLELPFYPSLEHLEIKGVPNLKGWWEGGDKLVSCRNSRLPSLQNLSTLLLESCPNLTYFPPCPNVKKLDLSKVNEKVQKDLAQSDLWEVELDNMNRFKRLST